MQSHSSMNISFLTFLALSILRFYWGHSYLQDWKWNCVRKHRRASKHGDDASLALSTTRCWQTLTKASLHGSLWWSGCRPEFFQSFVMSTGMAVSYTDLWTSYIAATEYSCFRTALFNPRLLESWNSLTPTLVKTTLRSAHCLPLLGKRRNVILFRERQGKCLMVWTRVLEIMYRWIYVSVYVCHSMSACKSVGMHECMHP